MKTKSIRMPEDLLRSIDLVEQREHIEEATAIRKLLRMGFEAYVAHLYKQSALTLREAAERLNIDQVEAMDLFLEAGIKGNLDAAEVMESLERFASPGSRLRLDRPV